MELAAHVGMPISEFWEVTPFELGLVIKGYTRRQEARHKESIHQAYIISTWVWAKPKARHNELMKLLGEKTPKKIMTDEEMLSQVKALNAVFGGEVVRG